MIYEATAPYKYPNPFRSVIFILRLNDETGLDIRERTEARMREHVNECAQAGISKGLFGVTACHTLVIQNGVSKREYLVSQSLIPSAEPREIVIAPHAVVASLPYIGRQSEVALDELIQRGWLDLGNGPINSVNLGNGVVDSDVTTIDVGSALLNLPEVQEITYKVSKAVPEFQQALRLCRIIPRD